MSTDPAAPSRRLLYAVLLTVAAGMAAGRILSVERLHEPSLHRPEGPAAPREYRPAWPGTRPDPWPTFSSNDRSRWATVRALVDHGTYVVGRRDPALVSPQNKYGDEGIVFEDGWQTVDKVLKPDTQEFYSSKPPLLATLVAGEYWLLKKLFGWDIVADRGHVIRTVLLTVNVLPLLLYLGLMARMAERFGRSDWGRFYVMAAACFGTTVTPFLLTFNNHTVATVTGAAALYLAMRIADGEEDGWRFAVAGLCAGFTACVEFPATALAAGLGAFLLWRAPARALLLFVPAALVPVAAHFGTNYLALGQWRPAYAEFGGPWYQYDGSHWRLEPGQVKYGIDWAGRQQTKLAYALQLLVGHHGVFSLTPVNLLAAAGVGWGAWRWARRFGERGASAPRAGPSGGSHPPLALWELLAAFGLLLSVVVVGFYVYKTDNYGGWTNGPRWLMWLTPVWLVAMLPVADALGRGRAGRGFALALLGLSVLSMSYRPWNPWRHPWIYTWMESRGWIAY